MLDVYDFYMNLQRRHGIDYAAAYFDIWFDFWSSCGNSINRQYEEDYCRIFKTYFYE